MTLVPVIHKHTLNEKFKNAGGLQSLWCLGSTQPGP